MARYLRVEQWTCCSVFYECVFSAAEVRGSRVATTSDYFGAITLGGQEKGRCVQNE